MSIGEAQYDEDEISVKVFRHIGQKWSRQSEEMPLHRVLDLTILIIAAMSKNPNSDLLNIEVIDEERVQNVLDYFKNNKEYFDERLIEIKRLLDLKIP